MSKEIFMYKGKCIEIIYEHCVDSPLQWTAVTFAFFGINKHLGHDDHGFVDMEDLEDYLKTENPACLPIHVFEHSEVCLRTSSQYPRKHDGWAYLSNEDASKEFDMIRMTPLWRMIIEKIIKEVLEQYEHYINGRTYVINIDDNETVEWYFGYDPEEYAKSLVDNME